MNTVVFGPVPVPAVVEEVEALPYVGPHYSVPLYVDIIRVLPGEAHPTEYWVSTEALTTGMEIKKRLFYIYEETK